MPRSSKLSMFLSLLFKALKGDTSPRRVAAFAKRLLQVAQEQSVAFASGALVLVSELLRSHKAIWSAVLQPGRAASLHFIGKEHWAWGYGFANPRPQALA